MYALRNSLKSSTLLSSTYFVAECETVSLVTASCCFKRLFQTFVSNDIECKELEMGLEYSFVDKNECLKQQLAVTMETVSHSATKYVEDKKVEDSHEFLRTYTDIFTKNIYATRDFAYKNLKNMINNDELAAIPCDKDSCVAIMTREEYNKKLEAMLNDGIRKGIYVPTEDTTLRDLKLLQDFLRRNFKDKYDKYEEMRPVSHEPGKFYATAKAHKFNSLDAIIVDNLKFRPIIAQIGTYTCNASKVISEYLKPLYENEYQISDTQTFASMIKNQTPLSSDEEYVSYDLDSLFTNIPVEETIEYINHQIYNEKKVPQICSNTIFRRLMYKLTTECAF